jgi:hypothetical protein
MSSVRDDHFGNLDRESYFLATGHSKTRLLSTVGLLDTKFIRTPSTTAGCRSIRTRPVWHCKKHCASRDRGWAGDPPIRRGSCVYGLAPGTLICVRVPAEAG